MRLRTHRRIALAAKFLALVRLLRLNQDVAALNRKKRVVVQILLLVVVLEASKRIKIVLAGVVEIVLAVRQSCPCLQEVLLKSLARTLRTSPRN